MEYWSIPESELPITPLLHYSITPFLFKRMLLRRKLALFNFTDKFFHRTEHGLLQRRRSV